MHETQRLHTALTRIALPRSKNQELPAMKTTKRTLSLLAISAAAFMLSACDQSQPPTVGDKIDAGIERTQEAATEAKKDMQAAGSEMKQDASKAGNAMADGAADMTITTKVKAALAADDQLSAFAISVDTTNKVVTLTGPAPTQDASDRANSMAQAVDGVSEVKNQLTVAGKS
jgi:osmotically-inducible protein OsmY